MLLGLVRPTGGEIELLGAPMPGGGEAVLPRVGSLVEGPAFHPYLSGRAEPGAAGLRRPVRRPAHRRPPDRRRARPGRTARGRRQALPRLLARDAPAAGDRRRAPGAARPADPRRADQRPGPAGHPRGAPPRRLPGRRRRDRPGLQPPAVGGRADVLARRRDARGSAGGAGHRRRGARSRGAGGGRGDHRRSRSWPPQTLRGLGPHRGRDHRDRGVRAPRGRPARADRGRAGCRGCGRARLRGAGARASRTCSSP